jgi:hypothetical protein
MGIKLKSLDVKVQSAVNIDENDLQTEFMTYTSTLAYWLVNRADAQSRVLRAKSALGIIEATVRNAIVEMEPKLRVDDLKARMDLDAGVQRAAAELMDAEVQLNYISAVCEAMRRKGDMLVSLGAHQRALIPRGSDLT